MCLLFFSKRIKEIAIESLYTFIYAQVFNIYTLKVHLYRCFRYLFQLWMNVQHF